LIKKRFFLKFLKPFLKKEKPMNNKNVIIKKEIKNIIKKINEILSIEKINEIAQQTNAIDKRIRSMSLYSYTLTMILANTLEKEISISAIIDKAIENNIIEREGITDAALSYQVDKRGSDFFKKLFEELMKIAVFFPRKTRRKIIRSFNKVNVFDATVIKLCEKLIGTYKGSNGKSSLKLHFRYNYNSGIPEGICITEGKNSDLTNMVLEDTITPNTLYLQDLGYYDFDLFKQYCENDCYFVSRVKINAKCVILKDLSGRHKELECMEMDRFKNACSFDFEYDLLVKLENDLIVRLVKVYSESDNKYYRYYTNLFDTDEWSIWDIKDLYTLRWSIEIFFRDLKHVLGCIHMVFRTKDRILSQIYSALCYYVIVRIFMFVASFEDNKNLDYYSFSYCSRFVKMNIVSLYKQYLLSEMFDVKDFVNHCLFDIKNKGGKKHYSTLSKRNKRLT
jgi:hypothetical protein